MYVGSAAEEDELELDEKEDELELDEDEDEDELELDEEVNEALVVVGQIEVDVEDFVLV